MKKVKFLVSFCLVLLFPIKMEAKKYSFVIDSNREVYVCRSTYEGSKMLKFVEKVNSTYPTGTNNVKTSKGRRIQILLIVDWKELAEHFKKAGFKTAISELSNY